MYYYDDFEKCKTRGASCLNLSHLMSKARGTTLTGRNFGSEAGLAICLPQTQLVKLAQKVIGNYGLTLGIPKMNYSSGVTLFNTNAQIYGDTFSGPNSVHRIFGGRIQTIKRTNLRETNERGPVAKTNPKHSASHISPPHVAKMWGIKPITQIYPPKLSKKQLHESKKQPALPYLPSKIQGKATWINKTPTLTLQTKFNNNTYME